MSFDNRQFNVNGESEELLRATIAIAFLQADVQTAWGYRIDPKAGLILFECKPANNTAIPFAVPMTAGQFASTAWAYLESNPEIELEAKGWDRALPPGDGSNAKGWRVYCGGWGHVDGSEGFLAIKPAWLWYGQ